MKKLLLIALMCISISTHAQKKFKQQNDAKHLGWIVTAGGVALTVGAVATPNELSRIDGRWQPTPIYQESARFGGLLAGCVVTASGVITMIATMEPKNKRRKWQK